MVNQLTTLVLGFDRYTEILYRELTPYGPVTVKPKIDEVPTEVRENATAMVIRTSTRIDPGFIERHGLRNLGYVHSTTHGTDHVDAPYLQGLGILLTNDQESERHDVAELDFFYISYWSRSNMLVAARAMKEGRWEKDLYIGRRIRGGIFGTVGAGNIGGEAAKRAIAYGMKVYAHDIRQREDLIRLGVEYCTLDKLLQESDFVAVHLPLTPETKGIISERELALMKPTAYLIQVSRGGIVDETALAGALENNRLAGAAIDVYTKQPPFLDPFKDPTISRLIKSPSVIATPFSAATTEEAFQERLERAAVKVKEFYESIKSAET